jgi:hippurate hydrolase
MTTAALDEAALEELYRDLHAHPELSFQEHRTAALVAERLIGLGYETVTGVGGTGVVGVLRNGSGPTVLLRADMDGLPVAEETGLPYASTTTTTDAAGAVVPLMHACGHDVHVTCLLGAARALAAEPRTWQGTLLLVFQPAEELGSGAQAMLDDGLLERFGRPVVVLGQHVAPLPAGVLGLTPGPAFAASDSLRVRLHGRGGHGSRPETAVDPILLAAAVVLRLQGVVSREVAGTETAVLTVGQVHAGTRSNIIPDLAELSVNVRSYDPRVRSRVLAAIERIVNAEAAASGAPRPPEISTEESFPAVVNEPDAACRARQGFEADLRGAPVVDPGPVTGSEDVGLFATAAGAPCVYWLLGGADPAAFAGRGTLEELAEVVRGLPSNHSAQFAPVPDPTLRTGVAALVSAARTWLRPGA